MRRLSHVQRKARLAVDPSVVSDWRLAGQSAPRKSGRTSAGQNDSGCQAFSANVPLVMHEICRSPKHQAAHTSPWRFASPVSIDRESLLAGRRGYFLTLRFARTCIQTMRVPPITKNGEFLCCNVATSH